MTTRSLTSRRVSTTLHVRMGRWFEASASGWGVVIVPLVIAAVLAAAVGYLVIPV